MQIARTGNSEAGRGTHWFADVSLLPRLIRPPRMRKPHYTGRACVCVYEWLQTPLRRPLGSVPMCIQVEQRPARLARPIVVFLFPGASRFATFSGRLTFYLSCFCCFRCPFISFRVLRCCIGPPPCFIFVFAFGVTGWWNRRVVIYTCDLTCVCRRERAAWFKTEGRKTKRRKQHRK